MSDTTTTKQRHLTYGGTTMLCGASRAVGYAEYAPDAPRCPACAEVSELHRAERAAGIL